MCGVQVAIVSQKNNGWAIRPIVACVTRTSDSSRLSPTPSLSLFIPPSPHPHFPFVMIITTSHRSSIDGRVENSPPQLLQTKSTKTTRDLLFRRSLRAQERQDRLSTLNTSGRRKDAYNIMPQHNPSPRGGIPSDDNVDLVPACEVGPFVPVCSLKAKGLEVCFVPLRVHFFFTFGW